MANWPAIAHPSRNIPVKPTDPAIKSKADGGYTMTRPRYTRMTRSWDLKWAAMTHADYLLLMAHYEAMLGGSSSFTWTCEIDGKSKTVRFGSEIKPEVHTWQDDGQTPKYWSVEVTLEEV